MESIWTVWADAGADAPARSRSRAAQGLFKFQVLIEAILIGSGGRRQASLMSGSAGAFHFLRMGLAFRKAWRRPASGPERIRPLKAKPKTGVREGYRTAAGKKILR